MPLGAVLGSATVLDLRRNRGAPAGCGFGVPRGAGWHSRERALVVGAVDPFPLPFRVPVRQPNPEALIPCPEHDKILQRGEGSGGKAPGKGLPERGGSGHSRALLLAALWGRGEVGMGTRASRRATEPELAGRQREFCLLSAGCCRGQQQALGRSGIPKLGCEAWSKGCREELGLTGGCWGLYLLGEAVNDGQARVHLLALGLCLVPAHSVDGEVVAFAIEVFPLPGFGSAGKHWGKKDGGKSGGIPQQCSSAKLVRAQSCSCVLASHKSTLKMPLLQGGFLFPMEKNLSEGRRAAPTGPPSPPGALSVQVPA